MRRALASMGVLAAMLAPAMMAPALVATTARAQDDAGTPPPAIDQPSEPVEPTPPAPAPVQAAPVPPAPAQPAPVQPAPAPQERSEVVQSHGGSRSTATITRSGAPTHTTRTATTTRTRSGARPPEEPEEEEDDGRSADFLWIEVEGGASYVDLIALQNESFTYGTTTTTAPTFVETQGMGPMIAVAGGFRLSVIALGVRGTFASYDTGFDIGTFGGEIHLRIPTPVIEPYIRVGAGYAWQGNANYQDPAASPATVHGWSVNGAVGLDVFVLWWLSLGVGVQVDFLNMTRQTDPTAMCMGVTDFCPTQNGDAVGVQGRAFAQIGLHF